MRQQLAPHRLLTIVAALVVLYGLALISFPYLVTQLPVQSWIRDRVLARWEERLGITMDFAEMRPADRPAELRCADGRWCSFGPSEEADQGRPGRSAVTVATHGVISWVKLISPEVTVDRADLSASDDE